MENDQLTAKDMEHIIKMGWEDCTAIGALKGHFGSKEKEVIELMRKEKKAPYTTGGANIPMAEPPNIQF